VHPTWEPWHNTAYSTAGWQGEVLSAEPVSGGNYSTFPFPFGAGRAGNQHQTPPGSGESVATAGDMENPLIFQKEIISGAEYGSIPQIDAPIISSHTSTDEYRRGGGRLGGGLGQQCRRVKTSLALSSLLSWKRGFHRDLFE